MFKNMKIGIKILLVILLMSLGTLLIISVNSYLQMMKLTNEFQRVNTTLGNTASEDSKQALQEQMEDSLGKIAQKQAQISNEKLRRIRNAIDCAAGYISGLYEKEDEFTGHSLPFPYETEDGTACSKYMLAPGVEDTSRLQQEVRLLSNCELLFAPELEHNPMMDNIWEPEKVFITGIPGQTFTIRIMILEREIGILRHPRHQTPSGWIPIRITTENSA